MIISTVVATAKDGALGKENEMPWYLPAEIARFKRITTGHPIIMGRKTHESIGRALPGRTNIVITHNENYRADDVIVTDSLEEAIGRAKKSPGAEEIFIIGGETIYRQALTMLDKIYLTKVDADIKGDKFFKFEPDDWHETSKEAHKADGSNKYNYEFIELERKHLSSS